MTPVHFTNPFKVTLESGFSIEFISDADGYMGLQLTAPDNSVVNVAVAKTEVSNLIGIANLASQMKQRS